MYWKNKNKSRYLCNFAVTPKAKIQKRFDCGIPKSNKNSIYVCGLKYVLTRPVAELNNVNQLIRYES